MSTTEPTINDAIAAVLRETRSAWRHSNVVRSENSGQLKGSSKQPDILVVEPNVSPVVIETEVVPASAVELDATARLGRQIRANGRTLLSAIAVRLPVRLRDTQGKSLRDELEGADDFEMALYTGSDPSQYVRSPHTGWISGSISDLSILAQSASIPPEIIDQAANQLVSGVSEAAGLLGEMAGAHAAAIHRISQELRQEDGEQTRRMAATILTNAFVFHETLAGGTGTLANVPSLEELKRSGGGIGKSAIIAEWRKILEVNYWPIFDIACRILEVVPTAESKTLIERIAATAEKLLQNRLMRSHDLTGAVFQRLIADRKFLAAYYTTPAAAALLTGLAIRSEIGPTGGSWSNADDVKALRIADFACGTGTLLSTIYQRVSQLHELAGGDAEAIHPQMMATALVGCDVLPAAAHLTASMLAGAHPAMKYGQSSIFAVPYGKQSDGRISLGSLDLLDPQGHLPSHSITAKVIEGMGQSEKDAWLSLPHQSFDVVIMNPPFTRATVHEAERIAIPNPMFAAFGSSGEEQGLMSKATERLTKGTSAHGNAGEGSIFLVLADRKLKPGGVLALVMPLSLVSGPSWENSRLLLANNYSNLLVISIAGIGDADISFSADTGMGECLIIGRKSKPDNNRATFVVLNKRPAYALLGWTTAEEIRRLVAGGNLRHLEDGPMGGTPIRFGDDIIGHAIDAPLPVSGGWNLARIADLSLAQAAYQLAEQKRVWLPTMSESDADHIPTTVVGNMGRIGPVHRDINGDTPTGGIRGPFDVLPLGPDTVPTYPILWAHKAERERTMLFGADCEGIPRSGSNSEERVELAAKVDSIWKTASHCHFNCDFRFNSQSTAMQFTPRTTIGGNAWLSIQLSTMDHEKALVLWANTSLGMLLRWWHSNKQQSGRGRIGKTSLETLPVLDVTLLKPKQLAEAVRLFDAMSGQHLLPMNEIDRDPVRKEMDDEFARNVLGLAEPILVSGGPLELLRMKLSREPSVRGQK
jgi:hypothetical protein